jgi:hypothetical protein
MTEQFWCMPINKSNGFINGKPGWPGAAGATILGAAQINLHEEQR